MWLFCYAPVGKLFSDFIKRPAVDFASCFNVDITLTSLLLMGCKVPFSQTWSWPSGELLTVVFEYKSDKVTESESLVGSSRDSSLLPQYLMTAMLTGAMTVTDRIFSLLLCHQITILRCVKVILLDPYVRRKKLKLTSYFIIQHTL